MKAPESAIAGAGPGARAFRLRSPRGQPTPCHYEGNLVELLWAATPGVPRLGWGIPLRGNIFL
jgi:hypothetical protein